MAFPVPDYEVAEETDILLLPRDYPVLFGMATAGYSHRQYPICSSSQCASFPRPRHSHDKALLLRSVCQPIRQRFRVDCLRAVETLALPTDWEAQDSVGCQEEVPLRHVLLRA